MPSGANDLMAVILSGGSGTRLWPLSSRRQRRCLNTGPLSRLDVEARADAGLVRARIRTREILGLIGDETIQDTGA